MSRNVYYVKSPSVFACFANAIKGLGARTMRTYPQGAGVESMLGPAGGGHTPKARAKTGAGLVRWLSPREFLKNENAKIDL